ncbi:MAG TPA: hypothetical protein VFV23_08270 [Verrucomicrobiae bacterium]|nr:hypothetical protein [Verrucomicrobiae bacterium]
MKKFILLGALFLLPTIGLRAQNDSIARIHFLGGDKISSDPASKAFANEFDSPEARTLENQTLGKLAAAPATWFRSKIPAGAADGSAQLRPLLGDLLKSEWIFEIRDAPGSPEYALAIRVNSSRAVSWSKNLQTLLESWTKISAQKTPNGWELKKHDAPDLIQFSRSGDWVIVDCGQNKLSLTGEILKPSAKDGWLAADLNWPRLAQLYPALAKFDFPKIEMQVIGHDGELHFTGNLNLSSPLPALAKWNLPATVIHQPFNSFTAVRGITPWLEKQSWARRYEVSPMPNQFFIWALPAVPFQTFAAAPVPNGNSALAQLDSKIVAAQNPNPAPGLFMPITAQLTNNEITWRGIPFASPFIRSLHEKSGDFLFGGFFPNIARSQPLPKELFTALNQPNLVYYHWEVTSNRAPQVLQISQLGLMLSEHKQLDGNSAAAKWLAHFTPMLGATVTTATEVSPMKISFTRRAPGGLTAPEFYALADWLEAPNFPGCNLKLPPRPDLKHRPLMHGHVPVPAAPDKQK